MSNNKFLRTTNFVNARKFQTKEKAQNIWSMVPKSLRGYRWSIQEFEDGGNVNTEIVSNNVAGEKVNPTYIPVDTEKLRGEIDDLSNKFSILQGNMDWLLDKMSNLDKQISDILHFIEFERFSACEGYKLCKALKDLRLQRRAIKNELELINIINCHTCNNIANGNTSKAIDGLSNKKYEPRVLSELFEDRRIDILLNNLT